MREASLLPFTRVRELAKVLRVKPRDALRSLGWRRESGRYTLRVPPAEASLRMPAGVYAVRSEGQCLVPYEAAAALAADRVRTRLDDRPSELLRAASARVLAGAGVETLVVAVLAHVDHGKTTLLDALLGADEASREPGGITQSVRPSLLRLPHPALPPDRYPHTLAMVDTPGHQVFTGMRAAASDSADLALVLVAADAGVQAQTREVLRRCARLGQPVHFAVSKLDLLVGDRDLRVGDRTPDASALHAAAAPLAAELRSIWRAEIAAATQSAASDAARLGAMDVEVSPICAPRGWGLVELQVAALPSPSHVPHLIARAHALSVSRVPFSLGPRYTTT